MPRSSGVQGTATVQSLWQRATASKCWKNYSTIEQMSVCRSSIMRFVNIQFILDELFFGIFFKAINNRRFAGLFK